MSNYEPTNNNKGKVTHSHVMRNIAEYKAKILHFKHVMDQLLLAYEGYLLSGSYKKANISEQYCAEGTSQQSFYMTLMGDAYDELEAKLKETYADWEGE